MRFKFIAILYLFKLKSKIICTSFIGHKTQFKIIIQYFALYFGKMCGKNQQFGVFVWRLKGWRTCCLVHVSHNFIYRQTLSKFRCADQDIPPTLVKISHQRWSRYPTNVGRDIPPTLVEVSHRCWLRYPTDAGRDISSTLVEIFHQRWSKYTTDAGRDIPPTLVEISHQG